jgi:1-acyl-sn-glycerol-3-phosphate acyltransferase
MTFTAWAVNGALKGLTGLLCRVDEDPLARIPLRGPLILVTNHVNFLEVPLVYTRLLPRPVTGWVKAETWDKPAMAFLFNLWGGIPIQRGEADLTALRRGLEALSQGRILAIAPEGTRSGTGVMQRGHPGVALLALRSRAPILPMVYYGGERFYQNLRRLRRTEFHIATGQPFYLQSSAGQVTPRAVRQAMADEIMYQMAAMLPPSYRGVYSDLSQATQNYLQFTDLS